MQEIPSIDAKKANLELPNSVFTTQDMNTDLFSEFLSFQAGLLDHQSFSPAPTVEQMLDKPDPQPIPLQPRPEPVADDEPALDDMKDAKLDSETFQAMKPQLEKYGVSKEEVEALEERVESEKGLTWGQFVGFLSNKMAETRQAVEFTPGQRQKMMTLLQKLGFSAPDAKKMVGELAQGNVNDVLTAMAKKLETLPKDKLSATDKDELQAFMKQLHALKNEQNAHELGLARVVRQGMDHALEKARRLALKDINEQGLGDKDVADNLAEAARRAAMTDAKRAQKLDNGAEGTDKTKAAQDELDKMAKLLSPEERLKVHQGKTGENAAKAMRFNENMEADRFLNQDGKSQDNAWSEFMAKLRQDPSSLARSGKSVEGASKAEMADALAQAKGETVRQAPWEKIAAPKVMKQVQDAVFKTMANGGKRLTLQLNPEQLGQISVALTVKNSEVSATIRAESPEAAKLIADQMESIRQALEDEGLKVTKLEVQTQLPGQEQNGWLGERDHNWAYERQAGRMSRDRMRQLQDEVEGMAGDMHLDIRQAMHADSNLHIVA